ncbi:hypothetical protein BGZ99_000756 [Dissophora globulifera]|uniref:HMG box domain-containing protein n=1 Tax=Dissophora globulifera TaxID=979702 RepID=A0A9P6UY54_9FUNG|nr:hypothetical protein BGZ99_000756 [Dissophora globulifera]
MSALSSIVNSTSPKGKQPSVPPSVAPTASNGTGSNTTLTNNTTTAPAVTTSSAASGAGAGQSERAVAAAAATTADDIKYKRKYKDLKKRIRDIEEVRGDEPSAALLEWDLYEMIRRSLLFALTEKNGDDVREGWRCFLFDKLDHSDNATHPSTTSTSTSDSDTDDDRNGADAKSHHRHHSGSSARHGHGHGHGGHGHGHGHGHGADRLKRYRHSYTGAGGAGNLHLLRSGTPPSRGSSVAGAMGIGGMSSSSLQVINPTLSAPQSQAASPGRNGGDNGNGGGGGANGAEKRAATAGGANKKRRKDPLAPKRPSNAFFIFSQQHRQQAREEKKEGNQSELTKFLGQRWKSMASTEKKIYSELAIQDRQRYIDEMHQYEQEHGQETNQNHLNDSPTKAIKKTTGKVGRPSKHDKYAAEAKENSAVNNDGSSNGNAMTSTLTSAAAASTVTEDSTSNEHLLAKKMGIHSMINGDTEGEGEEMTSHDGEDDEDDVRMLEDGTEDDHEIDLGDHDHDHDDENEEDEGDHEDEDGEDEEDTVGEGEHDMASEKRHLNGVMYGHGHGHGEDVDMVDAHRGQEPGSVHSLIATA